MSTRAQEPDPVVRPSGEPAGRAAGAPDPERAMRTCPNCGRELAERGCKLRCPEPACGYFLSCAEYH